MISNPLVAPRPTYINLFPAPLLPRKTATNVREINENSRIMNSNNNTPATSPSTAHELLLEKLQVFKVQGRADKRGRKILRIIGKFFPARILNGTEGEETLKKYLEKKIFPEIGDAPFCVVYVHTRVHRQDNFPGVSFLRSIYESLPSAIKEGMEAVYFVHPGLQARLFFATFGRFLFSAGLYGKLRYVSRLEFLGEYMRKGDIEVPEFVHDHDEELEQRPLMDYGLESGRHHRDYDSPAMDSAASMYSLRCIS